MSDDRSLPEVGGREPAGSPGAFSRVLREGYGRCGVGFARDRRHGGVLLAVSGGADSTALMVASAELAGPLGLRLEVACVDHGLRPESAAEAQAVRAQAEALGLPCSVLAVSLPGGAGLEARAREARYAALEAVRQTRGLWRIATAHTADDQAETLLMRLARGAALRGAVGIREVRGPVIRPMLRLRRADARAYLQTLGVPWREDPMNADPAFLRVRVRTRLLPLMTELTGADPSVRLAAFAEQASEDEAFLEGLAQAAWARLWGENGMDAVGLRALVPPLLRRVLVLLLERRGLPPSQERLGQAMRAVRGGGRVALSRDAVLDARGGWVRWEEAPRPPPGPQPLALEEVVRFGAFEVGASRKPPSAPWSAPVSPQAFPLLVRTRRPGDRVWAHGQARKLQDVLVDAKVPREQRRGLPVVCDHEGAALWVGGVSVGTARAAPGSVWIWARPSREAGDEARPSL